MGVKVRKKSLKKKETSKGKCLISITRRRQNLIRRKTHAFSIDFIQQQPLRAPFLSTTIATGTRTTTNDPFQKINLISFYL
jgi:hypothetical protein